MSRISRFTLFFSAWLLFLPLLPAQTQAAQQAIEKKPSRVKHKLRVMEPNLLQQEIQQLDGAAATMDAELAMEKVVQNFRTFIVAPKDIKALLLGLQEGEAVDLISPASGQKIHVIRREPAMSLGNAYVALSLAKMDLAQYEILQPTYEQLNKTLNGGTFVQSRLQGKRKIHMRGVLKQYASSRSWGQIAQRMGVSVEILRYDLQSTAVALADRQITTFSSLQPGRATQEKDRQENPGAL